MKTDRLRAHQRNRSALNLACFIFALCLLLHPGFVRAQEVENYPAGRARALLLYEQQKMVDALPLLERLHAANPKDLKILEALAWSTYVNSATFTDAAAQKQARKRARDLGLKAKELGSHDGLIEELVNFPPDGGEPASYSSRKEVDEAMRAGEAAFARGDFGKALEAYERALKLDPKQYEAALFMGDVYYKQEKLEQAGEWFAKATAINPDRETAYRYWGDSLLAGDKKEEALKRFAEAVIADPYSRLSWAGLVNWGKRYDKPLAHPRIDVPASSVQRKDDKNITIFMNPDGKADGTDAWTFYSISRAAWMTEKKFKEAFPNEPQYRHSLREEAESLRLAAEMTAKKLKEGKLKKEQLDPSLANLVRLNNDGLLEAFILLAKADAGIAKDYEAYRREHRDKLRQYVVDYVSAGGGK